MPSSFTSGKANLEKPANGSFVDTWDVPINADLDDIDNCFSGTASVSITTGTVTLIQSQMRSQRLVLSGTLSGNCLVNFFAGVAGLYTIINTTTQGAFSITIGQNSGATVVLPLGFISTLVFVDGTNVFLGDDGGAKLICAQFVPPGAVMDFAMAGAPAGWLVCDGSAVSRTTYAALFANVSTTWGVGNGSTTFNIPNFQGQFRRGWDQSGAIDPARAFASSQTDEFKQHNHGITEPNGGLGHKHDIKESLGANASTPLNSIPNGTGTPIASTEYATTGIIINNAGTAGETRPKNYAVLTCIKT